MNEAVGSGVFKFDAISINALERVNYPAYGSYFLQNGIALAPSTMSEVALTLTASGNVPHYFNLAIHGDASVAMPSSPSGGVLPVLAGESRPSSVPDPSYGGGSLLVQATGSLKLARVSSGDFAFRAPWC